MACQVSAESYAILLAEGSKGIPKMDYNGTYQTLHNSISSLI